MTIRLQRRDGRWKGKMKEKSRVGEKGRRHEGEGEKREGR